MPEIELDIIGLPGGREFRIAERFADRLSNLLRSWVATSRVRIVSVPSLQCLGCRVQDIDQILFLQIDPPFEFDHYGRRIEIGEVLLVIEVKGHRANDIRFEHQSLLVRYSEPAPHWLNVSEKAMEQVASVRRFLRELAGYEAHPVHAVFLPEVAREDIPEQVPSVLGGSFRIGDVLGLLASSRVGTRKGNVVQFRSRDRIDGVVEALRRARAPVTLSALNKVRVQRITERYARDQQFYQAVGKKLLVFQGKAGTGKTSFMVRLANDLARQGKRSLFLTFNHSLRVELLTLLNSDEALERLRRSRAAAGTGLIPRVEVSGLDLFMVDLLEAAGIIRSRYFQDYEKDYPPAVRRLADLPTTRLGQIRAREPFRFDFVFVDEAQDIRVEERDALMRLYGPQNLIVSIGHDQITRERPCEWIAAVPEGGIHVRRYNRSLRMKEGIVQFVDRLAGLLGISEYESYEGAEIPGGRVHVHVGKYSRELHAAVMADLAASDSGACPGDLLMAIHETRNGAHGTSGSRPVSSGLRELLRASGNRFWDGLDPETRRRNLPLSSDEVRICNYMSVRGLEAWAMVCFHLDRHFAHAERTIPSVEGDIFGRQNRAFGMVAIACTRPINSLVITLSDPGSDFSRACIESAREDPERCIVTGV